MEICKTCGGSKKSGYVQRLIAEGNLDPSKVSNPSQFIINLGKENQKRIEESSSKNKQKMENPKFYANSNIKTEKSHFAIYRLDSIDPPILTSVYGKVKVLNGNHYTITEKKNNQGKILRSLVYDPYKKEEDVFYAFASRGKQKGQIKDKLERYNPTEIDYKL